MIRVFSVLSVLICPYTYSFTVYNILNIMQNILREKYFDTVSEVKKIWNLVETDNAVRKYHTCLVLWS